MFEVKWGVSLNAFSSFATQYSNAHIKFGSVFGSMTNKPYVGEDREI